MSHAGRCKDGEIVNAIDGILNGKQQPWSVIYSALRNLSRFNGNASIVKELSKVSGVVEDDIVEDIVSEIITKLLTGDSVSLDKFKDGCDSDFVNYFPRAFYNTASSMLRKARNSEAISEATPESGDDGDVWTFLDKDDYSILESCIKMLPEKQQQAVQTYLEHGDKMDYNDMAELLGTNASAFGKNLHLAKANLTKFFRQKAA